MTKSIIVDGVEYIPAGAYPPLMADDYVIVRSYGAGVFAGELVSRKDDEVILRNARRLWYWKGAATLSELAMRGVKCPAECRFPCEVMKVTVLNVIEVIPATAAARESIKGVPEWTA